MNTFANTDTQMDT